MSANIHTVDEGYSVARHLLVALDDAGDDGCMSVDLGADLDATGAQVGAWLRDLRCRGWATCAPVSPASTRLRWYITDAGRSYLNEPE
jgi:hypothetical protein